MRVATKYPRIAARHLEETGRQAEIVEVKGSVELAPLTGMVEAIVDLTATGTTLRENNLVVREELMVCTARLIANPVAHKLKAARIDELLERLRGLAHGQAPRPEMRIERLGVADGGATRWPASGTAAHVRALVPDGASVEEAVREIVQAGAREGDAAVREYTRRFDTAGNEPKPLIVCAGGAGRGDQGAAAGARGRAAGGDRERRRRWPRRAWTRARR